MEKANKIEIEKVKIADVEPGETTELSEDDQNKVAGGGDGYGTGNGSDWG